MELRNVSNSKSDLQGHSIGNGAIPWATYDFLLNFYGNHVSCTVSEILLHIFKNLKRSCDPKHIPFGGNLSFIH